MAIPHDEPCYTIGVVARMVSLHPQTLRNYEQLGLVVPQRTEGNIRLYSQVEVERLYKINRLTQELGVNLAGVEVILHMADQIETLKQQVMSLEDRLMETTQPFGKTAHTSEMRAG